MVERIRPIAVCVFWRRRRPDQILVEEGYDRVKGQRFFRPLGGGIEFGERAQDALAREMREELDAAIANVRLLGVLENIFMYEGARGHEIVFVYDAEFRDRGMYEGREVQGYRVETGAGFVARWRSPEEIRGKNARLVPEGLADLLSRGIGDRP